MRAAFFFFFITSFLFALNARAGTISRDPADTHYLGKKTAVNKALIFDVGADTSNPTVRANQGSRLLEFSNDGTNYNQVRVWDSQAMADNYYCTATTANNAMTIAMKTKLGNDPSTADPVKIAFRSTTATSGAWDTLMITSAQTITIPQNATLGGNNIPKTVWVYMFNDAGTPRIGVSGLLFNPGNILSSTTISASATALGTIYTGTGVTSKAARVICKVTATANAGAWSNVQKVVTNPELSDPIFIQVNKTGTDTITASNVTYIDFNNIDNTFPGADGIVRVAFANTTNAANAWKWTVPRNGICTAQMSIQGTLSAYNQVMTNVGYICHSGMCFENLKFNPAASTIGGSASGLIAEKTMRVSTGDTIYFAAYLGSPSATFTHTNSAVQNWATISCSDIDDVR